MVVNRPRADGRTTGIAGKDVQAGIIPTVAGLAWDANREVDREPPPEARESSPAAGTFCGRAQITHPRHTFTVPRRRRARGGPSRHGLRGRPSDRCDIVEPGSSVAAVAAPPGGCV
jgi:hypothetical protein